MDWPSMPDIGNSVADPSGFCHFLLLQSEDPEAHPRAALPMGCLELVESYSHEGSSRLGLPLHVHQVVSDDRLGLLTCSVLADEPRSWKELLVNAFNVLTNEVPRRHGVHAMHPTSAECLGQILGGGPRGVASQRWILDSSDHVLETVDTWTR